MITEKEALNILVNTFPKETPEQFQTINLAIKALQKQIPMEPILMQFLEPEYMCVCGMKYWRKGGVKYCINCGQRLDWGE